MEPDVPIIVRRPRVIRAILAITALLLVLHWIAIALRFELERAYLWGFSERFNVDAEESFAQFLQMVTLLAIVVALWTIGRRARADRTPHALAWLAMAAVFLYLAIDESSRLHELAIRPLQRATGASGLLFFAWLVVAIPLVVVFVVAMVPLLRDLDTWTRRRFLLAGFLYVCGVVGMEMLGGWWVESHDFDATYYYLFVPIEELFEVAGQLLFLSTLLTYLSRTQPEVGIAIRDD